MFDIGFFELILIGIIGLVVLGPERLPHAIRMTSAWIGKIRRASVAVKDELEREINAHEMKQRIQKQMEEAGLDDIKKSLESAKIMANGQLIKEAVEEQAKELGITGASASKMPDSKEPGSGASKTDPSQPEFSKSEPSKSEPSKIEQTQPEAPKATEPPSTR